MIYVMCDSKFVIKAHKSLSLREVIIGLIEFVFCFNNFSSCQ